MPKSPHNSTPGLQVAAPSPREDGAPVANEAPAANAPGLLHIREFRQYAVATDTIGCRCDVVFATGEQLHADFEIRVPDMIELFEKRASAIAKLVRAWRAAGSPKTLLLPDLSAFCGWGKVWLVKVSRINDIVVIPDEEAMAKSKSKGKGGGKGRGC